MSFLAPVLVGDLVYFKASINDVGRTSLEVGVRVEAENLLTGAVRHISTAYIVYVAIDEQGRPTPVPPLLVETEQERKRQAAARCAPGLSLAPRRSHAGRLRRIDAAP